MKFIRAYLSIIGLLTGSVSPLAMAIDCDQLDKKAERHGAMIPGYQSGYDVIGSGRVQFYSAPDRDCRVKGVFVIPGDKLIAYRDFGKFTAVGYVNSKSDEGLITGWVLSSRLRFNGTGIAPKPE